MPSCLNVSVRQHSKVASLSVLSISGRKRAHPQVSCVRLTGGEIPADNNGSTRVNMCEIERVSREGLWARDLRGADKLGGHTLRTRRSEQQATRSVRGE